MRSNRGENKTWGENRGKAMTATDKKGEHGKCNTRGSQGDNALF